MPEITSRQHPLVRAFKAAARGEDDRALLDGWHLLHEAASAGLEIATIAVCGDPPAARERALLHRLAQDHRVVTVTPAVLSAMSPVRTPTGVAALASRRRQTFPDLLTPPPALVVIAADVQDPGNLGAIIRSAEAGGATGVLLTGVSADPWSWKALRAAMGSTFRVPVVTREDGRAACAELREHGVHLLASVPHGGVSMHQVDLRGPSALMLGGEGTGLSGELLEHADAKISIPMSGAVDSLNVAVAAALLIYEARRQRGLIA